MFQLRPNGLPTGVQDQNQHEKILKKVSHHLRCVAMMGMRRQEIHILSQTDSNGRNEK